MELENLTQHCVECLVCNFVES